MSKCRVSVLVLPIHELPVCVESKPKIMNTLANVDDTTNQTTQIRQQTIQTVLICLRDDSMRMTSMKSKRVKK